MRLKLYGFSLIELVLYLAMSSLCVLAVCSWASQIISSSVPRRLQQTVDSALLAAVDCCTRDLWSAPSDSAEWLHTDADWIEWRQGDTTIGYRLSNHTLTRIVSTHTAKRNASQVATAVHAGSFTLDIHKERVVGVAIELCLKNNGIERKCNQYVALRNGHC